MQVLLVNETIAVLVNHVEGLLELLDLGLVEHGEDIGSGPLRPLLGGLPLGAFAGHDAGWCDLKGRDRARLRASVISHG